MASFPRRKPGTLNETVEEVVCDLKKEQDVLLDLKERVMKEIKVLKVRSKSGGRCLWCKEYVLL